MARPLAMLALIAVLLPGTATAQDQMNAWTYRESIDLFTDEDDSFAYTVAHDAPSTAQDGGATMFCGVGALNGLVIGFFLDDYFGSGDTADVTYRVDGGTPIEMTWFLIENAVYPRTSSLADQQRVHDDWLDGSLLIFRASTRLATNTYQVRIDGMRAVAERLNCSQSDF